jgi:hypothetical protein
MNKLLLLLPILCVVPAVAEDDQPTKPIGVADCKFVAHREEFLLRNNQVKDELFNRVSQFNRTWSKDWKPVVAGSIARRNFVDDEIFNRMQDEGVLSARVSSDEEFFRRINLDLTGRLPLPSEIRAFLADSDSNKRSRLIDRLLNTQEFNDRWVLWLGDLVQNNASDVNSNRVNRQFKGRNAFDAYLRDSLGKRKSLKDIAIETVSSGGNNYDPANGAVGFSVYSRTQGGPIQDTYDTALVQAATTWLGQMNYDCLLCHNGAGHLDQLNLWGKNTRRLDAWKMAAFFAGEVLTRVNRPGDYYNDSWDVTERGIDGYPLNTNNGNRPNRPARDPETGDTVTRPYYQFTGAQPAERGNWRSAFAQFMVADRMFARNLANRLWKQMFGLGLVDPVDQLDPARLDPDNPPKEAGWQLQASHPRLLEKLADELVRQNYDLRGFLKVLADSSAYQLSSRYDGDWRYEYINLFARHYPRRLEGEEIFDVISQATGVFRNLSVRGWDNPVQRAVQMPDPSEPTDGNIRTFMDSFLRGNRDDKQRRQGSSLLQQLHLMNNSTVVLERIRMGTNPPNLRRIAGLPTDDEVLDELFLSFLSRYPTDQERTLGSSYLQDGDRNGVVEDLAWVCLLKVDFEFSY